MTEGEKVRCDVDDLMCQMAALSHLKGLKGVLGEERFKSSLPELEGLDEKLTERISNQESNLREAFEKCGLPTLEEPTEAEPTPPEE